MRITFLAAALLLIASIHAEEISNDNIDKRITALEKRSIPTQGYNPGADLAPTFFLTGDALYWQARENGLAYAIQDVRSSSKTEVKNPDFDWDFGFRVGAGFHFARDDWTLYANWTRFYTGAHDHGFTREDNLFTPIWTNPDFGPGITFVNDAKAHWTLHFNEVDLSLGRAFKTSRYLTLKPSISPSGVLINQHYNLNYTLDTLPGYNKVSLKNNFKGVGLRAGIDTQFGFRYGWSFFNDTSAGIYYGHFNLYRKEEFASSIAPTTVITTTMKESMHSLVPAVQTETGVRWGNTFAHERFAVFVKISYEFAIFFSQNQFLRPIEATTRAITAENQGDLTLSGGTISAGFSF